MSGTVLPTILRSRRLLALGVIVAAVHNLQTWRDVEWQGSANFFCDREDFPAVPGPSGLVVLGHRTDCDTIAKQSTTFVYLHPRDAQDGSSNLILRYDGDPPTLEWLDGQRPPARPLSRRPPDGPDRPLYRRRPDPRVDRSHPPRPARRYDHLDRPAPGDARRHSHRLEPHPARRPHARSGSANPRCADVNVGANSG